MTSTRRKSATGWAEHPTARLFPARDRAYVKALSADIADRGLLSPITLLDGMVLDGRARLAASVAAGVEPRFVERKNRGDVGVEVWLVAQNLPDRDLNAGQRAALAVEIEHVFVEDARRRAVNGASRGGLAAAAARRGETVHGQRSRRGAFRADPMVGYTLADRSAAAGGEPVGFTGKARDQAAALLGVSTGYFAQAKVLWRDAPDLFRAVKAGRLGLKDAMREHGSGGRTPARTRIVLEVEDDVVAARLLTELRRDERVLRAHAAAED